MLTGVGNLMSAPACMEINIAWLKAKDTLSGMFNVGSLRGDRTGIVDSIWIGQEGSVLVSMRRREMDIWLGSH